MSCAVLLAAYIYIRGEFYNEASNMQVAIQEVRISCCHTIIPCPMLFFFNAVCLAPVVTCAESCVFTSFPTVAPGQLFL